MLTAYMLKMLLLGCGGGAALASFRETFREGRMARAVTLAGLSAALLGGVACGTLLG